MTDLEMTKLCAAAMGARDDAEVVPNDKGGYWQLYDPLHDDAQAMALVKRAGIDISWCDVVWFVNSNESEPVIGKSDNLNRAIVECVAKMQAVKRATK